MSETYVRINRRGEVVVPFEVVGVPRPDLAKLMELARKGGR